MSDFLLELRSEEIPARMQDKAREDLARLFAAELKAAGMEASETITYATPRRLALIARGLPEVTASVIEEVKGPPADAPDAAIEGFLRKLGLAREALQTRDVKGRATLFAVISKQGRPTAGVLAEVIPAVVRAFPWPKSMRWGEASLSTESLRWVRPLQGIVALFGDDVVEFEVAGVRSGAATVGHRFHHPGAITIGSASDYVEKLRACHVVVDQAERRVTIALGAKMAANKAGLTLIEDEGLLIENAGLTEWPVPLLGRFDEAFLDVPPEVIQLTARVNQKYFVCQDAAGKLANAFVCTANIDAADGGAKIVEGNQKVLAARLSDARFFYETDLKVPLEEQAKKLEKIVFHEKLGTVADKVERVAKLARWLVEEGIVGGASPSSATIPSSVIPAKAGIHSSSAIDGAEGSARMDSRLRGNDEGVGSNPAQGASLADQAERAARLAKADLVTGMVGEFPELQGLMGGYYAAAQGEDAAVAEAIRDHYKPVGQGDDVPTAPVTVAVSLADKLDTLFSFYHHSMTPTGSKDPFALRRAELAIIATILSSGIRASLAEMLYLASKAWYGECYLDYRGIEEARPLIEASFVKLLRTRAGRESLTMGSNDQRVIDAALTIWSLTESFPHRLKVQQREAGVRHDLIDAVFALGGEDDLVRLLARVHALQAFMATDDGANLLAGYKRAANILKKEGVTDAVWSAPTYATEPAEAALIAALDGAEPKAAAAVEGERFEEAMAALATLRAPIDAFFTDVTVNDADEQKRESRLALLARMRDAVHRVADFGKIEG